MNIAGLLLLFALVGFSSAGSPNDVRRNVKDYGAKGDGRTDDTAAIILALTEGRGDNANAPYGSTTYSSSTRHPAYVYFPGGTYLVTATLPVIYYTQMVGDPANLPVIKFVNGGEVRVLEVAGGWYTGANQDNFYRQIRNFVIDMTGCNRCTGVHWQVAQATSITNVYFKSAIGSQSQGMWMENGSGGFISDITFEGGIYGMWVGNQQFTSRNITVKNASRAAIYLNWDWVWTFKNLVVSDCPVAVDIASGIGSAVIIDSTFTNTPIGVRTVFATQNGEDSLLLDNLKFSSPNAAVIVQDSGAAMLKAGAGTTIVKSWAQGFIWSNGGSTLTTVDLSAKTPARPSSLVVGGGAYFEMTRPLYVGQTTVDVTTLGVAKDGSDITAALQTALNNYANKAVLFFPHGTYAISNTVVVPPGSRLVGEAWSVLMAAGAAFQNANSPKAMLQIGDPKQTGVAQLSDFMISTRGPQPGAKLIEWNLHDPANAPGSNGMWDVHYRIGGAIGTNIDPGNCPRGDGGRAPASACTGAWVLLHITASASVYLENVWGWVADHDIDQGAQINVYNTRGLLVESLGPVWMYGTAMEHSVLYQYNLNGAANIFMGAIQTETPYYQPSSATPFARSVASDPMFCTGDKSCNMALGLVINNSTNVWLYSAGLYSFFSVWDQACLQVAGSPNCQMDMVKITMSKQLYMYALSTYGSVYMLSKDQPYSLAANNKDTFCATAIVNLNYF
jgi:glucan 1,3-beta-glucosidase